MEAALAASPIVVILGLMVGARWPAARAGAVGLVGTWLLAVGAFAFGRGVPEGLGLAVVTAGAAAESAFTAATILAIIVPALAIHHLQLATGATDVLRLGLGRLTSDPRLLGLLIAWFFALFLEGAAGFGASVALAAPFLVSAGYRRVDAVTIAMVGHAAGVSFGAVGTPVLPQIALTGFSGLELSRATGVYHGALAWLLLAVVLVLVARAAPESGGVPRGWGRGVPRGWGRGIPWGWGLLAGALFLVPFAGFAAAVGPELPTIGGALFGGLAFVGVLAFVRRRTAAAAAPAPAVGGSGVPAPPVGAAAPDGAPPPAGPRALVVAGAPYLVLVAAVLVTRLVPGVGDALSGVALEWELAGGFSGSVAPLYHPGTMLFVGFLAGAAVQRTSRRSLGRALSTTLAQLGPVVVALLCMLGISRLMVHAGMTDALAVAAAAGTGAAWPLFAPLVGALGTFVTGSATSSNILFTEFQDATAANLDMPALPLLGAQGFGAAVGNIICPHNIVAAGATVALTGREGEVLRRTLWIAVAYAAAGGVLALAFVHG